MMGAEVRRALGLLPPRERAVIVARYGLGPDGAATVAETARLLRLRVTRSAASRSWRCASCARRPRPRRSRGLISASGSAATLQSMTRIEFIQERRPDGSIVLRAVGIGPVEQLRRLLRRLMRGG